MLYYGLMKRWSATRKRVDDALDNVSTTAADFSGTLQSAARTLATVTIVAVVALVLATAALLLRRT